MLAFEGDEVVKRDGLGADVALLEIGVNHTRRLRACVAHMDGPGTHFFDARSEVGLQTQQGVSRANQAVQAGFVLAQLFQKHLTVFVAHLAHLGFKLGANCHHGCVLRCGVFFQAIEQWVVLKAIFGHVGHKHGGLGGDQEKLFQQRQLFFAEVDGAHGLGVVECGLTLLQDGHQLDRLFVARAGGFGHAVQGFFNGRQVSQTQLGLDDLDV